MFVPVFEVQIVYVASQYDRNTHSNFLNYCDLPLSWIIFNLVHKPIVKLKLRMIFLGNDTLVKNFNGNIWKSQNN